MDTYFKETDKIVKNEMKGIDHFIFHAPFNELYPSAIDPLILKVALTRYKQAFKIARKYHFKK